MAYEGQNEPFGEPGTGHFYGDNNFVLLGLVVEKISGGSLKKFLKDSIIRPLDMQHTFFITDVNLDQNIPAGLSDGYIYLSEEILNFMTAG